MSSVQKKKDKNMENIEELKIELKRLAKGKKLLIVEDEAHTRDVLAKFLGDYFPLIKTAVDGDDGWQTYRQENFDIVISDIEMPKTNGVMLSKGIKARNPRQVIVISSAYTDESYLVDLINIGIDGFLKKPVNLDQIYATMVKALTIVQLHKETQRVQFKKITQEVTKKDIAMTKSPYQLQLEESDTNDIKTTVKEFMENLQKNDPETYLFLEGQKEILFEILHDMVENYEMFTYKQYTDIESYENMIDDISRLYNTLEFFEKVKNTASEIYRLITLLKSINLEELSTEQRDGAFDILGYLIDDIKQYILDMFYEQNVEDINYFHDSLKENITTFENTLNNNNVYDDEIEFL